jgi:magnesium chelatase family protein
MHACPCGFFGDTTRECRCTPAIIQRYLSKISGPLLDRIDIHIEVPAVPYKELRSNGATESSAEIRDRVEKTRGVQQARGFVNARMPVIAAWTGITGRDPYLSTNFCGRQFKISAV